MVDDWSRPPALSRRRFLGVAGAGFASAVLLGGCGGDEEPAKRRPLSGTTTEIEPKGTAGSRDVALLNGLLSLEHALVAAYTNRLDVLRGGARSQAETFLGQEEEHADALAQAVKQLGGVPVKARSAYDLPPVRDQRAALRALLTLEQTTIAAQLERIPELTSPDLRGTAASIMATEAEHSAVLRGGLGEPQSPDAFVTGRAA